MAADQGYLQHPRPPDAEDNKEITVLEVVGSRVSGCGRGMWAGHNFCRVFVKTLVRNVVLRIRGWNSTCETGEAEMNSSKSEGAVRLGEVRN